MFGTVGRESGQIRLEVLFHTTKVEVQGTLSGLRGELGTCYSDEHVAYVGVQTPEREHKTVCHSAKEWARDDDGDGINEVHINTIEGLWTDVRNFLRRFKGVSKYYLYGYIAWFEWIKNHKKIMPKLIQAFCRVSTAPI